jgi:hypothetical protein
MEKMERPLRYGIDAIRRQEVSGKRSVTQELEINREASERIGDERREITGTKILFLSYFASKMEIYFNLWIRV